MQPSRSISRGRFPALCAATLALLPAVTAAQLVPAARGAAGESPAVAPAVPRPRLEVVYVHPDHALPGHRGARLDAAGSEPDGLVGCFANDRNPSGLGLVLVLPAPGFEILDWGVKTCGTSGWIGEIGVGYQTIQTDPTQGGPGATFGLRFYAGTTGGAGGKGTLIADLVATGFPGALLPGAATVTVVGTVGVPFRVPDGPIGWSYYDAGDWLNTVPLGARTDGGACVPPADPVTGTLDCLDVYSAADELLFSYSSSSGTSSSFLQLYEESALVSASTTFFNAGTNPASYSADRVVLGEPWHASVDVGSTGHTFGLVFGFDSSGVVPLGGGQTLLAVDGGSGELLALSAMPGPVAAYQVPVPPTLASIGVTLHTQAIHFGGATPFRLSNRLSLLIGTL